MGYQRLRGILFIWGLICLLSPFAAMIHYPDMKHSTPQALNHIETSINEQAVFDEETKNKLNLAINRLQANDSGLKLHSNWSYNLLTAISLISSLISFYIVCKLKVLMR